MNEREPTVMLRQAYHETWLLKTPWHPPSFIVWRLGRVVGLSRGYGILWAMPK